MRERNSGSSGGRVVVLVVTRTWVQVRIGDCKISPDIGSNPVSNILLVHRVLVDLVLAGAWHVQILGSGVGLHTIAELGLLALLGVRVSRVTEVKVTQDLVFGRSREILVLDTILTLAGSKLDTLGNMSGVVRSVFLGSHRLLIGVFTSHRSLGRVHDHKARSSVIVLRFIRPRAWHLKVVVGSFRL